MTTEKAPSKEAMDFARLRGYGPGVASAMDAFAAPVVQNLIELAAAHITVTLDRDALRARHEKMVALAHTVADKYDIYVTESFIDTAKGKHRAPTTHARLELSEAVDAMLAALAADAKAIPADDDGDGDNDTREILFGADAKAGEDR